MLSRDATLLVIGERVPSLQRRGRSHVGLCPFHEDTTGTFHVSPERRFFYCFGCKASGSLVDFVMRVEAVTFPEAVHLLTARFGPWPSALLLRLRRRRSWRFRSSHARLRPR